MDKIKDLEDDIDELEKTKPSMRLADMEQKRTSLITRKNDIERSGETIPNEMRKDLDEINKKIKEEETRKARIDGLTLKLNRLERRLDRMN